MDKEKRFEEELRAHLIRNKYKKSDVKRFLNDLCFCMDFFMSEQDILVRQQMVESASKVMDDYFKIGDSILRCSFCHKSQADVKKMICISVELAIGDKCVNACKELLNAE